MYLQKNKTKGINLLIKDNLEEFLASLTLIPLNQIESPEALLQTFKCSKNSDLEEFLHTKALDFGKRGTSRTHLLIRDDRVIGYFTLSMKPILTDGISKEVIKKIDGFSKNRKCIYFYLIGQLGLHDDYIGRGIGDFLLYNAFDLIEDANKSIGGRYILVDAINSPPVLHFYKKNGFTRLITQEENSNSVKMIYKI